MIKTGLQLVNEAKNHLRAVPVDTLHALVQQQDVTIIDVREPAEYTAGHIAGAFNLPRGILEFKLDALPQVASASCAPEVALEQLRDETLYLICRTDGRSALAALSLQQMGFKHVYFVEGGMNAWLKAAYPVK